MGKMILCALALMCGSSAHATACYLEVGLLCGKGMIDQCELPTVNLERSEHACVVQPEFICSSKDGSTVVAYAPMKFVSEYNGTTTVSTSITVAKKQNRQVVARSVTFAIGNRVEDDLGPWYIFANENGFSSFIDVPGGDRSEIVQAGKPAIALTCEKPEPRYAPFWLNGLE